MVVAAGMVYVYSVQSESMVYAFQASTGNLVWSAPLVPHTFHAGMQTNEPVAMSMVDRILYVLSCTGDIYALDGSSGTRLWSCETLALSEIHLGTINLTIRQDTVYYTDQHQLMAKDIQRSRQRWLTTISPEQIFLTHSLSDTLLFASADLDPEGSYIYAFSAESGQQLWQSELLPDPIFSAPIYADDLVFCIGGTTIYALDVVSGTLRWEQFVGNTNDLVAHIENEHLYLCLCGAYQQDIYAADMQPVRTKGALLALNCTNGLVSWFRNITICPSMFHVKHGVIYVGQADGKRLYAFDAYDGTTLWLLDQVIDTTDIDAALLPGFGSSLIVVPS
ncbi:hypothetical protein KDK_25570 [Dictyobacter kobayashii]|uniref:Pyrrolo-quinoline quinone repeat domain-containing protein n=2 Tax=Dictyobacter kobayashii TaxID=2014872 RepID=A0A402AI22_9CHLR|nr:hypothetical protein KDK_25570 [Dictyobacter kobayashii]